MKIIGYYDEKGYRVVSDNPADDPLYQAGNHALDSQQDGTGTEHQLPLATIKDFCERTAIDIAEEKDAEFVGVEYCEE